MEEKGLGNKINQGDIGVLQDDCWVEVMVQCLQTPVQSPEPRKKKIKAGSVVHTYNPHPEDTQTGGFVGLTSKPTCLLDEHQAN